MLFYFKNPIINRVKHVVSFSGGKDSSAMLIRMVEEGMPIDDIVFLKVMATETIGAELPEMYQYIEKMEDYIHRKITVVPSILNFDEVFHKPHIAGDKVGQIYGFPVLIGSWCNSRLKIKTIQHHQKQYGKHIQYLGIAADEPERLARLKPHCRAPLADWGMTEQNCIDFLKKRDMLNPLYKNHRRLWCWFCIKQNLDSLRTLRHDYPEYWQMMLQWDLESPHTFRPDCTVHDLERRFAGEDCQLKLFDDNDYINLLNAA